MKVAGLILVFVLLTSLNACMWGGNTNKQAPAIAKDTLVYTYQTIKQHAGDCDHKLNSGCMLFSMYYPIFKNAPTLASFLKLSDTAIISLKKSFFSGGKKDTIERSQTFEYDDSLQVIRQDSSLVTIQDNSYSYYGGAHGMDVIAFVNWDSRAKNVLKLNDIFKPGYEQQLTKIAEIIFRRNEKLSQTASLADDYFFKDDKFALNTNFLITPLGIKFLYNEYEIKGYSAGPTELFIPYLQIKSLLRPNTVITQYIK